MKKVKPGEIKILKIFIRSKWKNRFSVYNIIPKWIFYIIVIIASIVKNYYKL